MSKAEEKSELLAEECAFIDYQEVLKRFKEKKNGN